MDADQVQGIRARLSAAGMPVDNVPDDHIREMMHQRAVDFRDKAPTTAAQAANIILDGVRQAPVLGFCDGDEPAWVNYHRFARSLWCDAYDPEFIERLMRAGHFGGLVNATAEAQRTESS